MSEQQKTEPFNFRELMEAGRKEVQMQTVDIDGWEIPATIVPKGYEIKAHVDLMKKFSEVPARLKQFVEVNKPESFIKYLKRHHTPSTAIFCDVDHHKFVAVLDYHEKDEARWGSHVAELKLQETPEWKLWQKLNREKMNQEEFALFVEDNMLEIQHPPGAEMLEVAKTLQSTQSVNFRSSLRLEDGQVQLNYQHDIDSSAGEKGNLVIPDKIKLGITLYRGGDGYEMEARFRHRIHSGKINMWYELIRPDRIVEHAVNKVFEQITEGLKDTSFAVYHGKSPVKQQNNWN